MQRQHLPCRVAAGSENREKNRHDLPCIIIDRSGVREAERSVCIVPTSYRRHRPSHSDRTWWTPAAFRRIRAPSTHAAQDGGSRRREQEHLHCRRRPVDCITFLREGEEGTSTPIQGGEEEINPPRNATQRSERTQIKWTGWTEVEWIGELSGSPRAPFYTRIAGRGLPPPPSSLAQVIL